MQRGYYSMFGGDAAAPPPGRGRAHCQLPAGFVQLLQVAQMFDRPSRPIAIN
jgi:hypothetical protein